MKYTDHHVHTSYSPDSDADIEKYLIYAKDIGLSNVMFTDHIDMGAIEIEFQKHIDYNEYFQTMKNYEEKYGIKIKIGVEIGYEKSHKNEIDKFLGKHPFDFVIASVHYGGGKDFYLGDFFDEKSQYESYMSYFELILEMVENFTNYDVVGHLDHIVRYGDFEHSYYDYKKYKEIIDLILKTIIKNSRGIEVNTAGLRGPLKTTFPKKEVIMRYKELGGRIITVGSDAHLNEEYNKGVIKEIKHLKKIGFKEVTSFKKRKIKQNIII